MSLSYFDLHCDTLHERLLGHSGLHLDRDGKWAKRKQIYAVWSDFSKSPDEQYENFFKAASLLPEGGMLAVEGGDLLGGDINRLDAILREGIVYFTPVWRDENEIGGAWNTDVGLTDFGREVVKALAAHGVAVDLSHASDRLFYDTMGLTDNVIASHSCSRAVCSHGRNLTDGMFRTLVGMNSRVGVSLYPFHLNGTDKADVTDAVRHIDRYMSLGGQTTVCLGCDFDGIEVTPTDITCPAELYRLADALGREGYSDSLIEAIFYENANTFFENRG